MRSRTVFKYAFMVAALLFLSPFALRAGLEVSAQERRITPPMQRGRVLQTPKSDLIRIEGSAANRGRVEDKRIVIAGVKLDQDAVRMPPPLSANAIQVVMNQIGSSISGSYAMLSPNRMSVAGRAQLMFIRPLSVQGEFGAYHPTAFLAGEKYSNTYPVGIVKLRLESEAGKLYLVDCAVNANAGEKFIVDGPGGKQTVTMGADNHLLFLLSALDAGPYVVDISSEGFWHFFSCEVTLIAH
jgi:hypothetical protein